MATNRYEVVLLVSSSVHVIVEAENENDAQDKAFPIAEEAVNVYEEAGRSARVPNGVKVWMGSPEDVAFTDDLGPATPVYADGMSTAWGV